MKHPPVSKNKSDFFSLAALGSELRQLHLFDSDITDKLITNYPEAGSNFIDIVSYENDKVTINDKQYFNGVPQVAWNFYIGGYQPAQKWLKDRKGVILAFEDIIHYQKIIYTLIETHNIINRIDSSNLLCHD